MSDARFVSEPVTPLPGAFDPEVMRRGEPSLPPGFVWRGREYRVVATAGAGRKTDDSEGETYVKRHTWRLDMDDGSTWSVYFLRQPAKGAAGRGRRQRWYLRSVEAEGTLPETT